uniref:Uncharacterized protein n=1 Tax=blood disease bacterium R229 TaxID=741978 RepID=G2ZRQ8_9RALS|nr:conserved hypothetical protein [blood disease bacterium R229]
MIAIRTPMVRNPPEVSGDASMHPGCGSPVVRAAGPSRAGGRACRGGRRSLRYGRAGCAIRAGVGAWGRA